MDPMRRLALVAGICYLITFVSIPTLALYGPVREAGYIVGSGPDTGIIVGGILELIVALAGIGTAVALFPVVKRQNESVAMGFVGARVLEAACIFIGVGSLLTIVALRLHPVGSDALATGDGLVAMYDKMFLIGQSIMPAINALLLGSLMYQTRLVPRILPTLGLVGAPLLIVAQVGVLFDLWGRTSTATGMLVIPIFIWEFGLGIYLTVKGFRPEAVERLSQRRDPLWEKYTPTESNAATLAS